MKYFYKIIILLLFISSFSLPQGSWEKIKTQSDFNLLKVFYLDSLHCWVAGDSGVIMFSNDQGSTWEMQNSGVNNYISDIFFLNDTLGWALTFDLVGQDIRGQILKTSDGGLNWQKNPFRHLNMILTTLYFKDELNGWMGLKPNGILVTADGGNEWNESSIDTGAFGNFPVHQIGFSNETYGFAVGGHVDAVGVCWSSSDNGKSWTPHGIGPDLFLDYVFIDSARVISLTAELEGFYPTALLKFNLEDNSWTYMDTPEYVYITALSKRNESEIWGVVGRNLNSFFVSFDKGDSWSLISSDTDVQCMDIAFADSLHGIAVGDSGYVLKYIPDSTVSVDEQMDHILRDFHLNQNFPNPFNPNTRISWQSPISGWNTIKVFDILGNELVTLVDDYRNAGNHYIDFNLDSINKYTSSGVYFYQLKIGEFIVTRKMILLK